MNVVGHLNAPAAPRGVSILALALVFGRVSATSFGGGQMASIRREVVRRQRWLEDPEFLEMLALAQIMPGANPANMAVLVGRKLCGNIGAAVALVAAVLPGFIMLMLLAALALGTQAAFLRGALRGCAAAAVGLTLANALELSLPRRNNLMDVSLILAVALAVTLLHLSLEVTLLIFVPCALLLMRKSRA